MLDKLDICFCEFLSASDRYLFQSKIMDIRMYPRRIFLIFTYIPGSYVYFSLHRHSGLRSGKNAVGKVQDLMS